MVITDALYWEKKNESEFFGRESEYHRSYDRAGEKGNLLCNLLSCRIERVFGTSNCEKKCEKFSRSTCARRHCSTVAFFVCVQAVRALSFSLKIQKKVLENAISS